MRVASIVLMNVCKLLIRLTWVWFFLLTASSDALAVLNYPQANLTAKVTTTTPQLTVVYSILDPLKGHTVAGSWSVANTQADGVLMEINPVFSNGMVVWVTKEIIPNIDYYSVTAHCRAYDLEAGVWQNMDFSTPLVAGTSGGYQFFVTLNQGILGLGELIRQFTPFESYTVRAVLYDSRNKRWAVSSAPGDGNGGISSNTNITVSDGTVTWPTGKFGFFKGAWIYNGNGQPYAYTVSSVSAGKAPLAVQFYDLSVAATSGSLSFGMGTGSVAALSGSVTYTQPGIYDVTQTAMGAGVDTYTRQITVTDSPVITSNGSADGMVGAPFYYQSTATNTPISYDASGLPSGLSVNTTTGLISGTPTTAGVYPVMLSATNASGTGRATLTLTVTAVKAQSAFFAGESVLSNGVYYLSFPNENFFGYYSYLADPHYIYHFDLGYEYVFDANDGKGGVYLYDFKSNGFFYTSPSFPFPYLYDFSLKTVLYYYPDPKNPGRYNTNGVRYFLNTATGQIISK